MTTTISGKKTRKLSWKAKRDGSVFCAPACGALCKHKDFELAHKRAAELAKRLGPGWTVRVWENMGWHYQVQSRCHRLHVSEYWRTSGKKDLVTRIGELEPDHYTAFLNTDGGQGGRWTANADTPEDAIREVIELATAERDEVTKVLVDVGRLLPAP